MEFGYMSFECLTPGDGQRQPSPLAGRDGLFGDLEITGFLQTPCVFGQH